MRRTSTTASLAAGIRAHHRRWNPAPIFADEYAVDMVSLGWASHRQKIACSTGWSSISCWPHSIPSTPRTFSAYSTPRTVSARAIEAGPYAIRDSRRRSSTPFPCGHRELADQVQVFEVDHPRDPAHQARARAPGPPGRSRPTWFFVAVDFEADRLGRGRSRAVCSTRSNRHFFSWLGDDLLLE